MRLYHQEYQAPDSLGPFTMTPDKARTLYRKLKSMLRVSYDWIGGRVFEARTGYRSLRWQPKTPSSQQPTFQEFLKAYNIRLYNSEEGEFSL